IPDLGFAFVVLTNAEPGGKLLAQAALDAALSEYPGTAQLAGRVGMMTAVLAPAGEAASAKAPARPADYVGSYTQPYVTYTVQADSDQLSIHTEFTDAGRQVAGSPVSRPTCP
ncbi:MAG: hypothetical protein M3011_02645, partial [Actinomycetota bacterium]|nr:hypothetical protein [Actinomycetota bacterium]